jgi:hypothetical protein
VAEDWNISRRRYYGLPLPFYPCACGHLNVIGSHAELVRRAVSGQEQLRALPRVRRRCAEQFQAGRVPRRRERRPHRLRGGAELPDARAAPVSQRADADEHVAAAGKGSSQQPDDLARDRPPCHDVERGDHVMRPEQTDRSWIVALDRVESQHVGEQNAAVRTAYLGSGPVEVVDAGLVVRRATGQQSLGEDHRGVPLNRDADSRE